jgi:hypothetical protein
MGLDPHVSPYSYYRESHCEEGTESSVVTAGAVGSLTCEPGPTYQPLQLLQRIRCEKKGRTELMSNMSPLFCGRLRTWELPVVDEYKAQLEKGLIQNVWAGNMTHGLD